MFLQCLFLNRNFFMHILLVFKVDHLFILVFPLSIFRRVQHPAHFSSVQNAPCPFLHIHVQYMHCSFYRYGKKEIYCFQFKLRTLSWTFYYPLPLLEVCTGRKFKVLWFTNGPFNLLHVICKNIFLRMIYFYATI